LCLVIVDVFFSNMESDQDPQLYCVVFFLQKEFILQAVITCCKSCGCLLYQIKKYKHGRIMLFLSRFQLKENKNGWGLSWGDDRTKQHQKWFW
jgi:hypothetical protein